jgi:hypothetical protein
MLMVSPDIVRVDIDHSLGRGLEIIKRFHRRREQGKPIIVAIPG